MKLGETVYVVEHGVYAERRIVGIYATPEAAMEAHPVDDQDRKQYPRAEWDERSEGHWDNGCDYGLAVDITAMEIQGPAAAPHEHDWEWKNVNPQRPYEQRRVCTVCGIEKFEKIGGFEA
jgi:hypothetical protein